MRTWQLESLTRLDEVAGLLARGDDFDGCLLTIVDAAIQLTRADKGNLQLLDPLSGCLVIRAQRGFDQPFLDFFSYVDADPDAACGAALVRVQRVLVTDVTESDRFARSRALEVLLKENVRAVLSAPLKSSGGYLVGMVSTHFTHPTQLGERELSLMDVLARQAADYIERKQKET